MDYFRFVQIRTYLGSSTQNSVLSKISKYSRYLSDKTKLFLSLLLDSLFTHPKSFSKKISKEVHELLEDENQRVYVQYCFLAKKAQMRFEGGNCFQGVSRAKLGNFEFLFRCIFAKERERNKINDFLMYSLLRFASQMETLHHQTLICRFQSFPFVQNPKFWKAILLYMSKHIYQHLDSQKRKPSQDSPNAFVKSFTGFFSIKKTANPKTPSGKASQIKSFEEISSLLFRINLDFSSVVDILLEMARAFKLSFSQVKDTLVRNREVLRNQLMTLNKIKISRTQLASLTSSRFIRLGTTKKEDFYSERSSFREQRFFQVFSLSLEFLVVCYDVQGDLVRRASQTSLEAQDSQEFFGNLRTSEIPLQSGIKEVSDYMVSGT